MNITIVAIEGVLSEHDNFKTAQPRQVGKSLYDGMKSQTRMVLITAEPDRELVGNWLRKEGFKGYAMLMCYPADSIYSVSSWKTAKVREILGDGWDVGMYVDSDDAAIEAMLTEGLPCVMVSYPAMANRPGWMSPDRAPRPWGEVVDTMERENLARQEG